MCRTISEMKMLLKCFLSAFLLAYSLTTLLDAHAEDDPDQTGFISIDCGLAEDSEYTDSTTGLYYKSDAGFTSGGENKGILASIESSTPEKHLATVRSFPQGNRNCYTLKPSLGKHKYLIRASFLYGSYDGRNQLPKFNLTLGADTWDTVDFYDQYTTKTKEIIHASTSSYIHVCLVKTGLGTPFISALELRPFNNSKDMYPTNSGSLNLFARVNFDSTTTKTFRYKDDVFDRMWTPIDLASIDLGTNATTISSPSTDINYIGNYYQVPTAVLRTASRPVNASEPLYFDWEPENARDQFYIYMHFAEVEQLQANQSREFNIYMNQDLWSVDGSVVLDQFGVATYSSVLPRKGEIKKYEFLINKTLNSTLPPIINALELYVVKQLSELETKETDVDAIISIKSMYGVRTSEWQGDPCEPKAFMWNGLNCSYNRFDPARIISLDLSKSGLTGVIAPSIGNLTELTSLDLSNNKLTGIVPDFLSQLTSLNFLNLKGNNFTERLPAQLLEKANKGLLTLVIDNPPPDICDQSPPCKKQKNKSSSNLPVVAAVVAGVVVLGLILFGIWMIRKRKQRAVRKVDIGEPQKKEGEIERKDRQFSYSEVMDITNNFQRVLGKGGFGTVYHGYVGDTQVAVKMLSPSSTQGYREFQAEARVLMTVHHKNLSSLVGYCNEDTNMGIIYEYMANGNLYEHLSAGRSSTVLGWEERLLIAMDAAQGLEYLHHGCKPPIIHRDVKTSNILLTDKFQAKLADFGLSRACQGEGGTHVSTSVAGTPGYLDPEYSNRLTEKSDVYSFGIVLLEIITGRPAIVKNEDKSHIVQWVDSNVRNGDVKQVVDPRFRGDFDVNSVWKAVELAMTCASRNSAKRPTMNFVVLELKECLAIEVSRHDTEPKNNTFGLVSMNLESDLDLDSGPAAR